MRNLLLFALILPFLLLSSSIAQSNGYVTINLNSSKTWWNDSLLAYGVARYSNGLPITDATVSLFLNNESKSCPNTNSNGEWECDFKAPLELGDFEVSVRIEKNGEVFINSTSLQVKIEYGETGRGEARSVFEEPILIQEPSGRIRIAMARVIVWK